MTDETKREERIRLSQGKDRVGVQLLAKGVMLRLMTKLDHMVSLINVRRNGSAYACLQGEFGYPPTYSLSITSFRSLILRPLIITVTFRAQLTNGTEGSVLLQAMARVCPLANRLC